MNIKKDQIGFVGLGNMGHGIYASLKNKGFNLIGFDKLKNRIPKEQENTKNSLDYIFQNCRIIFFCISTNHEIFKIIKKNYVNNKTIIIDLTTSLPEKSKLISKYLKKFNSFYLDCAMSGGALGAKKGTLSLMSGGNKNIFLKIRPLLLAFSENIFYLGDVGSGQLVKLLHNSVCHGIFLMNCEILQAGENFGVSANKIINVFNKSNARSFISERRFPDHILNKKFDGKSIISNLKKDLNMANKLLKNNSNFKSYTSLTSKKLNQIDKKFDNHDFTTIYKNWEKLFI